VAADPLPATQRRLHLARRPGHLPYLGSSALLLGGGLHLLLHAGARLAGRSLQFTRHLALCLVPTGAAGLFLGLSATTVKLLRYEGLELLWVGQARVALLALAMAWSLWLGWRVSAALPGWRRAVPIGALLLGNALIGYGWWLQFWGW
jgi:hypothetical protein